MVGLAAAVGVLAVSATLAVGVAAASAATVRSAHAAGAADAAALAAADTASGALIGIPCDAAAQVADAAGARLIACDLDGLVASVRVEVGSGAFAAHARARAGPPSWPEGAGAAAGRP